MRHHHFDHDFENTSIFQQGARQISVSGQCASLLSCLLKLQAACATPLSGYVSTWEMTPSPIPSASTGK